MVQPTYLIKAIYPKAVWRKSDEAKKLYLTFDDGPIPEITEWVLIVLKQYNIKATFFCVGDNIVKHPGLFQKIIDEQHSVGNHTFNHLNGWKTHSFEYMHNISKCNDLVQSSLFRPPYGKMKKAQYRLLQKNYSIIMWDVLSGDYDKNTSPEKCLDNVIKNYRAGSIVLFHDSIKAWERLQYALPRFIEHALHEGYSFEKL